MFTHRYEIRYSDYKTHTEVKPSSVLDFVQDVSIKASDACGYGIHKLREMNLAWLLQGIKLHFNKPLSTLYSVDVSTAIKDMKGVISDRGCILSQNGEIVAKTVAAWFIFDGSAMRPIKIPDEIAAAYTPHNFDDDFYAYKKIKTQPAEKVCEVTIHNKEIDTNNHLNNHKSAEILMDALPFDFFFSDANIFYKKACFLGDKLSLCRKETENGYYVHLETPDGEICVAGIFEKL